MTVNALNRPVYTLRQKLWQIHWLFVLLLVAVAGIGFAMLYSAAGPAAGEGSLDPWASRQMVRFAAGVVIMVAVALTNIRLWLRYSYVIYLVTLVLLAAVEFGGTAGMAIQCMNIMFGLDETSGLGFGGMSV